MKLEIEDKKVLALFMGWEIDQWPHILNNGTFLVDVDDWNPDYKHPQFTYIWNHLTPEQQMHIIKILMTNYPTTNPFTLMLNDLPVIMETTLLVIKLGKSKRTSADIIQNN